MAPIVTLSELIEAGTHFGHRVSRWNPKMKPFIYGKRNLIHILDLRETVKGLVRAANFLERLAGQGGEVIFVGTKRQAKKLVAQEASRCGMHYVNERWLGGTLTNFQTIMSRLKRLEELETLEKGGMEEYSKKMGSSLRREKKKIVRNLEGIRNMKRKPDALVVIDPCLEHICIKEAKKLGIPTICILDSNCDPDSADIAIPGNDDAFRSVQVLLGRLADAILRGRGRYKTQLEEQKRQEEQRRVEEAKRQEALRAAREAEMKRKKAEEEAAAKAGAAAATGGAEAAAKKEGA
ncbi:MAG TPA: 30S ribosomal protein S2 [Planctomycetota bacterium]|nr:30S ribosomal protein S2 [Planctomycetota bacterium]